MQYKIKVQGKGDAIDFMAKFYGIGKKDAAEQRFERAEKKCFRVLLAICAV